MRCVWQELEMLLEGVDMWLGEELGIVRIRCKVLIVALLWWLLVHNPNNVTQFSIYDVGYYDDG